MARTRVRYVDAPPRNDVYVGMLALSVFAIVIGCAVLALESDDYGWSTEAKAPPAVSLPSPSVTPKAAAPTGTTTPTPPAGGNTPAPAPMNTPPMGGTSRAPKPADPVAPPTAVAATPPTAPAPAVTPTPAENATVNLKNEVPRPGFNPNLPRK